MLHRPALRPGAPLLRRSATHLQVGTSPGIVVADRPGLMALLRLLDGVRDLERIEEMARQIPELDQPVVDVLTELAAVGAVVDAAGPTDARRRRATGCVAFDTGPGAGDLVAVARTALGAAGVGVSDQASEPDLLVVASFGEPARAVFERAALLGVDHLPVVIDEDRVRIGPLVRPGRTPCVSCHDLHRADWDPAWPALLLQVGRRPPLLQPPATDPLTLHAAGVELAAEVTARLDGRTPRTIGRCLVIGPGHDERATWPVSFHHRCSCDLLVAA